MKTILKAKMEDTIIILKKDDNSYNRERIRKAWIFLGIAFIIIGLLVSLSSSIFENTITFSNYDCVIIDSNDELNLVNSQIRRASLNIDQAGIDSSSAVLMVTFLPLASNEIPREN